MHQISGRHLLQSNTGLHSLQKKAVTVLLILVLVFGLCACNSSSNEDPNAPPRDNTPKVLPTEASGKKDFSGNKCKVDYSNTANGYVMAQYKGSNKKVKLQLIAGDNTYNYDLATDGEWQAFPLSSGDGEYTVGVFENISGEQYSQALKESFSVKLNDEFQPFLHPNQYINFTESTKAVGLSQEICDGAKSDLGAVERIFDYNIENIEYDFDKAKTVQPGYLPNIDETLDTGKGICFDYAAVMSSMLRAQGIPCKLVIGYAGTAYHAWISVYLEDQGWVNDIIEFDGKEWTLMDPTFAASGNKSDPNLVGDGEKYNPQYYY